MGRRSRSIQGNGDVRVCVQGSGRTLRRGDTREPVGRSCRARLTAISPTASIDAEPKNNPFSPARRVHTKIVLPDRSQNRISPIIR
jgi:hypothetical protein